MMNCIQPFIDHALKLKEGPAIWDSSHGITTFEGLYRQASGMQAVAHVVRGDTALVCGSPSPALYAAVIGLIGLGCTVIFIEPWMPLAEIEEVILQKRPKIFVTHFWGRLWGLRVKAIREIPRWLSLKQKPSECPLIAVALPEEESAILTFTTGTTGKSKVILRTHGILSHQSKILASYTSELVVLPHFVFLNLSLGKCSVLLPRSWKKLRQLPPELSPSSVSCGPAVLKKLIQHANQFPRLRSFAIGGCLTDCALYERGMATWPLASWVQIYGSTEAEPVAIADIREVVKRSRARGLIQSLYLGHPIPEITLSPDGSLSGPHIHGSHQMGDRIFIDQEGWWYRGRIAQEESEFLLEQKVAAFLNMSALFIRGKTLIGEGILHHKKAIMKEFPEIREVVSSKLKRDRRHRARIDRKRSAPWVVG
jgi:acyl-coenzyme A synthetase/AMP-(fatty) acid ligase